MINSFQGIWKGIISKNVYDLSAKWTIDADWLIDMLLEFWSTEEENSRGRNINHLELNLQNCNDVLKFFKALNKNYMIKTLRLYWSESIDTNKEIEEVAYEFRRVRIATEVSLNSEIKRFKDPKSKCFEIFYPETS